MSPDGWFVILVIGLMACLSGVIVVAIDSCSRALTPCNCQAPTPIRGDAGGTR